MNSQYSGHIDGSHVDDATAKLWLVSKGLNCGFGNLGLGPEDREPQVGIALGEQ